MLDLLQLIPKPIAITIASLVVGGSAVFGMETRYMTVADFTKSYILDLKREIRELRKDIDASDSQTERERLEEQLESLLDELCLEVRDDPYCQNR